MKVLFLHIEKCGGTSIRNAFREVISAGPRNPSPVIDMDGKAAWETAARLNVPPWPYRDTLLSYFLSAKHSRLVMGHFRFNRELHGPFLDDWFFTTVLREPVDRFLSHYYYNRFKKQTHGKIEDGLEEYLENPRAGHAANTFVSQLTAREEHFAPLTEDDIEAACENLRQFAVVGVLERLDAYRNACESALGRSLDIPFLNPSPAKERGMQVSDELLERIRGLCAPSRRVYEAALDLIVERG